MNIALFGATGQTGLPFMKQALFDSECRIKAMVRNAEKLKEQLQDVKDIEGKLLLENERLTIIQVNEDLKSDEFVGHLQDVDAVVSTLGFPIQRPCTRYSDFTKSIVNAMKKTESCRRLILMHSWFSKPETRQHAHFLLKYTLLPYISCLLDDMNIAEQYLLDSETNPEVQDIDFTVVLPGGLTKKPVTDSEFIAKEDEWYVERIGGNIRYGGRINREDVARYLLKTAKGNLHSRKIVAIATKQ